MAYRFTVLLLSDIKRLDLLKHASAMAYVTLLSLVPSLAVVFTLISLFKPFFSQGGDIMGMAQGFILQNLASGSGEQVVTYLESFIANIDVTKIGITSFAALLYTLITLLNQIEQALNRIWYVTKTRHLVTRFIYFWTFLTLGTFLIGITIGVISGFSFSNLIPNIGQTSDQIAMTRGIGSSIVSWGSGLLFFFLLYKVVPNCTIPNRSALIGGIAAFVLFQIASKAYGYYALNSKSYSSLYGSLAAVPLFLLWLYICWVIILIGGLISWRAMMGFPVNEEVKIDKKNTPEEDLRDAQLQTFVPAFVLLAIYRHFRDGSGTGLTGIAIAEKLNLRLDWVERTIETLSSLGFVVGTRGSGDATTASIMTEELFPAFPADTVSLQKLISGLTDKTREWLANWATDFPTDFVKALMLVKDMDQKTLTKSTLADLLVQVEVK